ncbi:hypothetical protein [Hymenobacter sp. B1770]|uniref:hypothetical protein n=1 Tax=Hymenobacter sp. B1770 TaxID=1718788 RepID=UPI003CE86282
MLNILAFALLHFASLSSSVTKEIAATQTVPTTISTETTKVGGTGGWVGDIAAVGGTGGWVGDIAAVGGTGGWVGDIVA